MSLLYLYSLSFPWKTIAYLESGCNLFESDLKSNFEKHFAPDSFALISSSVMLDDLVNTRLF